LCIKISLELPFGTRFMHPGDQNAKGVNQLALDWLCRASTLGRGFVHHTQRTSSGDRRWVGGWVVGVGWDGWVGGDTGNYARFWLKFFFSIFFPFLLRLFSLVTPSSVLCVVSRVQH
jgi:hypothetical protein